MAWMGSAKSARAISLQRGCGVRAGLLVLVALGVAFELGCSARTMPARAKATVAAAAVTAAGPAAARDPFGKLREALEAAKRKTPSARPQSSNRPEKADADASLEGSVGAVGTSGGGEPPSPTASSPDSDASAAPTPDASSPSAPEADPGATATVIPAQSKSKLIRNGVMALAFIATVVLLVLVLFKEHHRHE